jgi:predicted RNA-binding Zn ribbon-like protein
MTTLMPANKRTRPQGRIAAYPRLLGGALCLDFANTIDGRLSRAPEDFLHEYVDLARWSVHVGLIESETRDRLDRRATDHPVAAAAIHERSLDQRRAGYEDFCAVARGEPPSRQDLEVVAREHVAALRSASLSALGGQVGWVWDPREPDYPLAAVAVSAVELLTHGDPTRVKECPGAGDCGWLYLDMSRNRSRRWCSMEGCGSRVKMRRQYARRRGPRGEAIEGHLEDDRRVN